MLRKDKYINAQRIQAALEAYRSAPPNKTRFHFSQITIKCVDCGATRLIHSQDKHQVKRCKACQRKLRNARPRPKSRRKKHARVVKQRKARRPRQQEPVIPDFGVGPASAEDGPQLIL